MTFKDERLAVDNLGQRRGVISSLAGLLPKSQAFANVVVMPTEAFHQGSMFRGGPLWPRYRLQFRARHALGWWPFPRDERPQTPTVPAATIERATWCGPIAYHFGHAVADFGMRIAASGHADHDRPLLFGMVHGLDAPPPDFFWQVLDHLRIDRRRVVLVHEPTLVRSLQVFPQAERRGGPSPSSRHLDLMDRIVGRPNRERAHGRIYVSRSRLRRNQTFLFGQIAGESYLEELIAARGWLVIHPEEMSVQSQMLLYQRARTLVFAEGSAVHGLQLLGRLEADVVVIARSRARLAESALKPRARSTAYIHALRGTIHGLQPSGHIDHVRAIAVMDSERLLDGLASAGLNLRASWDAAAYRRQCKADIMAWREATLTYGRHPRSDAVIRECLRRLAIQ